MRQLWKRTSQTVLVLIIIMTFLGLPLNAAMAAENDQIMQNDLNAPAMAVDLLVVRPLGIVATVCGSALCLLSLPFAAAGGNMQEVYDKTVAEPAAFTFKRPLGQNM
jgi:hypothetical protein